MSRILSVPVAIVLLAACPGPRPEVVEPGADPVRGAEDNRGVDSKVTEFSAGCLAEVDAARRLLPAIIATTGVRTVDNTLRPYNQLLTHLSNADGIAGLNQNVHPDEKIRDAARACEKEVAKTKSDVGLSRPLYDAIAAVDASGLDAASQRFVARTLRDFRRNGVDKDDATRARLKVIDDELTQLVQQWYKNINTDTRYVEADSVVELGGLPADFVAAHPPGKNGKIRISTDSPDFQPVSTYAESGRLRRALYIEFKNRGGEANEVVLGKILTLRREKANILGYANWADYITADKMMKSGDNAAAFIARVVKIARPRAERDYQELLARKAKDFKAVDLVEDYEKDYYANKVKAESYAFDAQDARPYFAYPAVEKGLLDITGEIFDLTYTVVADAELWHPSVKAFDVSRAGKKLGRVYLDMHPRAGKYKHAAQFTKTTGVKGVQLPEGALVCNFPNPADGPALMEHRDVVVMFHEFGHLMHNLLGGDQRWIEQSGVATEWDFVEAPSQVLEEWAWSHETLARFAVHYQTGAAIPAELVARMRRAKQFGIGIFTLQQMFYASVSLEFHRSDPATLDMGAESERLQTELTPFRHVYGTHFHTSFGHLAGYSAIYYTYMWSLVIAKDLLAPLLQHGLMNKQWTHRYRDAILVPGGTRDAADLVEDFLGRKFSYAAFEEYIGG